MQTVSRKKPLAVMMSARANVFYLQYAKVCQDGDRVVYWVNDDGTGKAFNIPDKNTAFVMLGKGTSITDAAARKLAESGVLVGFCGNGGSPLFSTVSHVFLEPHSEYRPTEYMQRWVKLWFDESARFAAAKIILIERIGITKNFWVSLHGIEIPLQMEERFKSRIETASNTTELLTSEAEWAKGVYATLARKYKISDFTRQEGKGSVASNSDAVNGMIDHGNYIAYGYAATVLTTLGISYALPLLHGKTRRGALVFDVADLIKDAVVLPMAFKFAAKGESDQEFRYALIDLCWEQRILDLLFETIKKLVP
ncbi:MAG: type I-F CRISPR-associated endonuclease Cas1 [Pseudomonadota bacterium]|nr:type I-F CRISPR-associated endonuclease Cas1 [Pseudomonadota bacterium]